jgi:hypothetical protein
VAVEAHCQLLHQPNKGSIMKYQIYGKTLYELFNDGTISNEVPFNNTSGTMITDLKEYFKRMSESKIEVAKSNWILSFAGKSLENLTPAQWAVKKDGGVFDQFAGATITPRKSVQATYRGLQVFKAHQAQLINP